VHDAVDLFVVVQDLHPKHGPAALSFYQPESEVIDRMAMAQPLVRSRQIGFR
jgi:hypothetical protein